MNRILSRKFLLALGAIFTALGAALQGAVSWADALATIQMVVLAYLGVEGAADAVERFKKK